MSTLAQGISGTYPRLTWSWEFLKYELCLHNRTISRHVASGNTRVGRTLTLNVNPTTPDVCHSTLLSAGPESRRTATSWRWAAICCSQRENSKTSYSPRKEGKSQFLPKPALRQPRTRNIRRLATLHYKAWVARAAKQPMVLETVDLGPLGAEEVEVAVESCGLCHSDLSMLNNEWGI